MVGFVIYRVKTKTICCERDVKGKDRMKENTGKEDIKNLEQIG